MTHSAKCHDHYFCCFCQIEQNDSITALKNTLLSISLDGKSIHEIPYPPQSDDNIYFDFFTQNNELYAKSYREKGDTPYQFDYAQWKWKAIRHISNLIYEDTDYKVFYESYDIGGIDLANKEYLIEFKNRHSQTKYYYPLSETRIVRNNGSYYFINNHTIFCIDNPKQGRWCKDYLRYNFRRDKRISRRDNYVKTVYQTKGKWDDNGAPIYDTIFRNMWCVHNQLYFLTIIDNQCAVTTLIDGHLQKIMDLENIGIPFYGHNAPQGDNPASNGFLMQFQVDSTSFGLIDVVDERVVIHLIYFH